MIDELRTTSATIYQNSNNLRVKNPETFSSAKQGQAAAAQRPSQAASRSPEIKITPVFNQDGAGMANPHPALLRTHDLVSLSTRLMLFINGLRNTTPAILPAGLRNA